MASRARTKIVCTIGPACDSEETLGAMMDAGMDVARINFSHGEQADHAERIRKVRKTAESRGRDISILGDLQGPKWRVGLIRSGFVNLNIDASIVLTTRNVPGDSGEIHLPHPDLVEAVSPGQRLFLDDGLLEFVVLSTTETDLDCRVLQGGSLSSHKGVSAPGTNVSTPALTEKDRSDARFAVQEGVDFLALSFVKRADDIDHLRGLIAGLDTACPIVAKIETIEALENFDGIVSASDAVMIARGDLGVETPPEEVPFSQKDLIARCNRLAVPVITATQMLNSMVTYPRPTRAETSDVANSILDGTSAIMLSAETASGKYPVQSVEMMSRIASYAEKKIPYGDLIYEQLRLSAQGTAEAVAQSAIKIAHQLGARAIIASTLTGKTAQLIASRRPRAPVVAITPKSQVHRRMTLVWGVTPMLVSHYDTTDEMVELAIEFTLNSGLIQAGDTVVFAAGSPPGPKQSTNMVLVRTIEE